MSDYKERFRIAAYTEKWAVTMTKVRIRQAVARAPFPRWHFVSFAGPDGGESRGVVDLIAIRKDHAERKGLKRGRSEENTSELQSLRHLVCRLLLEKIIIFSGCTA